MKVCHFWLWTSILKLPDVGGQILFSNNLNFFYNKARKFLQRSNFKFEYRRPKLFFLNWKGNPLENSVNGRRTLDSLITISLGSVSRRRLRPNASVANSYYFQGKNELLLIRQILKHLRSTALEKKYPDYVLKTKSLYKWSYH